MKILAIETSGKTADLCILDTELDKTWEKQMPTLKGVSEVLTEEIEDLFKSTEPAKNLSLQNIDLIAVGIGPGSYTGTRIGIATAKGLAQGLSVPIIGITSFEALIEAIDENYDFVGDSHGSSVEIIPLIDARNDRVYYQIGVETGCENIEEVLQNLEDKNYVFVGTGATANQETIQETFGKQSTIEKQDQIQSKFIAQIADGRAQKNLYDDVVALKPLYINKPKIG